MVFDVSSGVSTFLPVFAFLLIFAVVYGLLSKSKALGDNKFVHLLTSFSVAVIFLASSSAVQYTKSTTGFFAAFIISLLFIVLIVGLIHGKVEEVLGKGFAWFVIITLILIFVFSAIFVFKDLINTLLAKPKSLFLDPTIFGIVILVGLTVFASWLMTKDKK
jgi:hypothetical protein